MPGLADTTALLARARRQAEAALTSSGGEATLEETAAFGLNPGGLRMLSYVPEGLPPGAPLVVVLHGCTQRAEAHAAAGGWLTLADRYGFAVLAPEQTPANNPNRCFNWFQPEDAARGGGEAASIRAMVAQMLTRHGLDPARVFVTGLSAGGAMTAALLAAYPDVFAAGGIVAGLPYGVADNVQEAMSAMYADSGRSAADLGDLVRRAGPAGGPAPRLSIWHGDADTTVRPHNAVHLARQWAAVHGLPAAPTETERLPGRTRTVWRSPSTGEALIESNLVQGLAHGTPLSTAGPDGVGSAAPYMLEAGVSSSLEIARFWGLAPAADPAAERAAPAEPEARADAGPARGAIGEQVMASIAGHVPADVKSVIEGALKTAGLMG